MRIRLQLKEFTPKKLVSNDIGVRILLEGIEGADYTNELAELAKVMYQGRYLDLDTILEEKNEEV